MAHRVKCLICGETFDRDKHPCVQVTSRRFAHKECYENQQKEEREENEALFELENYIKKLFDTTTITSKIARQIKKYITENHYTYAGILKTLKYWYEIKGNDTSKSNGGIGIVEYIYDDARNYYYEIYKANQFNKEKKVSTLPIEEIRIKPPIARVRRKHSIHLFDEEV